MNPRDSRTFDLQPLRVAEANGSLSDFRLAAAPFASTAVALACFVFRLVRRPITDSKGSGCFLRRLVTPYGFSFVPPSGQSLRLLLADLNGEVLERILSVSVVTIRACAYVASEDMTSLASSVSGLA
jgi:hypothetical protein